MISEKELMANVIELARFCGWMHYHTYESRRSPHGFPDLVLIRRGRLLFAELKSERGRLTIAQKSWLDELKDIELKSGRVVEVHVWRPHDWLSGSVEKSLR